MNVIRNTMRYVGYVVKCRRCKAKFNADFSDIRVGQVTGSNYVNCPCCGKLIYKTIFWKRIKKEDKK